jgi:tetratricopeptide (TPR) repeat protein
MKNMNTLALAAVLLASVSIDAAADPVDDGIARIQKRWAEINYEVVGEQQKEAGFEALEAEVEKLADEWPDRPEPKIWDGIVLSTHAGVAGAFSALEMVKSAKKQFEAAIAIDDTALGGSAQTSLGSLYYRVPGWPLGFGSDKKAEQHLRRALAINPDGIDANYFYGDYLFQQGRFEEASEALERAIAAPARPGRDLADSGRRQEARELIGEVKKKLGS